MKILRSIRSVNREFGGPSESLERSSAALIERGHEVEIVSLDPPSAKWLRDYPFPVHALGPGWGTFAYAPRFADWVRKRRAQYDAVIVHGIWQYSSFGVWRALHGTTTPYFVFPHGMLDPWFNRTYPLKHLKKLLYWPWGEYRVLRDATAVLFTSEEERLLARESFSLYHCNEVVVNYGTAAPKVDLDSAREDFLSGFPQLRGKRFLLFLGRLHEKKGCDLLIEAFTALGNFAAGDSPLHLVLAGPCADEEYLLHLKQLAATAAKEDSSITFTGMLTGTRKWGAFRAAEVFVLPSHQENFGIAVVEALACGTPVLISNKVNIWREIEADHAGYAENDDLAGTTVLLKRWLATPPETRAMMKKSAPDCFARRFEIERATDSLLKVLNQ